MGYTLPEFEKTLGGQLTRAPMPWRLEKLGNETWQIDHVENSFSIQIKVRALPPRRLALLELPVLEVNFRPLIDEQAAERVFFDSFFKHFQKGGG